MNFCPIHKCKEMGCELEHEGWECTCPKPDDTPARKPGLTHCGRPMEQMDDYQWRCASPDCDVFILKGGAKDCGAKDRPCTICPTPTECLEVMRARSFEDPTDSWNPKPDAWKSSDLEERVKRFAQDVDKQRITASGAEWFIDEIIKDAISNYHQAFKKTVVKDIYTARKDGYEAGKDAAYAAMTSTASEALERSRKEGKLEVLRAIKGIIRSQYHHEKPTGMDAHVWVFSNERAEARNNTLDEVTEAVRRIAEEGR